MNFTPKLIWEAVRVAACICLLSILADILTTATFTGCMFGLTGVVIIVYALQMDWKELL